MACHSKSRWPLRPRGADIGMMEANAAARRCGVGGQSCPISRRTFEPKLLARETRYLRRAILDALESAEASPLPYASARCGIVLGTTLHGMRAAGEFLRGGDASLLSTFLAAPVLRDAIGDLEIHGFAATTCSACSSSLGAIVQAVSMRRAAGEFSIWSLSPHGYDATQ